MQKEPSVLHQKCVPPQLNLEAATSTPPTLPLSPSPPEGKPPFPSPFSPRTLSRSPPEGKRPFSPALPRPRPRGTDAALPCAAGDPRRGAGGATARYRGGAAAEAAAPRRKGRHRPGGISSPPRSGSRRRRACQHPAPARRPRPG